MDGFLRGGLQAYLCVWGVSRTKGCECGWYMEPEGLSHGLGSVIFSLLVMRDPETPPTLGDSLCRKVKGGSIDQRQRLLLLPLSPFSCCSIYLNSSPTLPTTQTSSTVLGLTY